MNVSLQKEGPVTVRGKGALRVGRPCEGMYNFNKIEEAKRCLECTELMEVCAPPPPPPPTARPPRHQ